MHKHLHIQETSLLEPISFASLHRLTDQLSPVTYILLFTCLPHPAPPHIKKKNNPYYPSTVTQLPHIIFFYAAAGTVATSQ